MTPLSPVDRNDPAVAAARVIVHCPKCGAVALSLSRAAVTRKLAVFGVRLQPTPALIAKMADTFDARCQRCAGGGA